MQVDASCIQSCQDWVQSDDAHILLGNYTLFTWYVFYFIQVLFFLCKFGFCHIWKNIYALKTYCWLFCLQENSKVVRTSSTSKQQKNNDGIINKKGSLIIAKGVFQNFNCSTCWKKIYN